MGLGLILAIAMQVTLSHQAVDAEENTDRDENNPPWIIISNDGVLVAGRHLCGSVGGDSGNVRIDASVGGRPLAGSPDTTGRPTDGINAFCFPVPAIPGISVELTASDKHGNSTTILIPVQ